jgi:hypothetical protein
MADTLDQIAEQLQKVIEWAESSGQRSQASELNGLKADLRESLLKRSKRDMDLAREHAANVLQAIGEARAEALRDAADAIDRDEIVDCYPEEDRKVFSDFLRARATEASK